MRFTALLGEKTGTDNDPGSEGKRYGQMSRAGRVLTLAASVLLGSMLLVSVAALIAGFFGVNLLDLCGLA